MKTKWFFLVVAFFVALPAAAAEKAPPQNINVRIVAAPSEPSPEGFIEETGVWRLDSAKDFQKNIHKKCWHPKDKVKKATPEIGSVCFKAVEGGEDVTVTVAARGENAQTLGQRTTMSSYFGVVVADSVPTVGVTRWVSIILTVGTYKKEFVAWHTNQLRWSLGAWGQDAKLLAQLVMDWCLLNQEKLRK